MLYLLIKIKINGLVFPLSYHSRIYFNVFVLGSGDGCICIATNEGYFKVWKDILNIERYVSFLRISDNGVC